MSLKVIILLVLIVLTSLNAATPIASYHFDESGWADGATVYDSSREQNNLIAHNEVNRTNINQKVCESAEFDGTDEYMSISSSSSTNITLFSFMCSFFENSDSSETFWFKTTDTNATLLAKELTVTDFDLFNQKNGDKSLRVYIDNGKVCTKSTEYTTSLNTTSKICTTDSTYSNDKWYHLTHETATTSFFFFFQQNSELMYIHDENGNLLEKIKQDRYTFFDFSKDSFSQSTLLLGTSQEANYYSGLLDEVNLFDDSISENEIDELIDTTRICSVTSIIENIKLDAWETTISDTIPTNVNDRKIYTKIVSKEFNLSIGLTDDTDINKTHSVRVRAVPMSYCEENNKTDYDAFSPWQSFSFEAYGSREKNVTFSPIKFAERNAYVQFEIESVSSKFSEEKRECKLYYSDKCYSWDDWGLPYVTDTCHMSTEYNEYRNCAQLDAYTKKSYECSCSMGCSVSYLGSTQTSSCTETVVEECGYIWPEDYQKVVCEKNVDYFTGSETNNTCSSDNFAIRPNSFTSPTLDSMPAGTPMVAGQVYQLDILALDAQDENTTGYDQSFSNTDSEIGTWYKLDGTEANRTYVKENGGVSGEFIQEAGSQTNFTDGVISNINFSYSDVGFFDVSMVDRDWAKVDITDNNPDENASVIMTTKTFRVAPYEFNISVNEVRNVDFNTDTNESRFTYLSNNPSTMGARGRVQVDALNARGELTKNYTTGLYENNASIYIKVNTKFEGKDANMSFGNGNNGWYKISDFVPFSKGSLFFDDPNSAHFNYERNSTNYTSTPFRVEGKDIDVNVTDNDFTLYKDGNFSHPEGNVTFFYGRINAIDGRILPSNRENIGVFVEIYCDSETIDCNAYDVNMTNSPTDFDWYLHFEHNENSVEKFNDTTLVHPRLGTFTDVNITNMYGSYDSYVKAYLGSSSSEINTNDNHTFVNGEANMTIGYYGYQTHTTHVKVTPSEWLEHTSPYKSPILRFKVTFPGGSLGDGSDKSKRAGMGIEGDSNKHMDSNSSKITTRRMSW